MDKRRVHSMKMPLVFIGHGSPMNAIEDNPYTSQWKEIAKRIPTPRAIISFSAHWYTRGTKIMNEENPKTIYDMYGFPKALYEVVYKASGAPAVAAVAQGLIFRQTEFDRTWGIDHGTWSVLVHMYPERNIPVFQISIDALASNEEHYRMGRELRALRDQDILLFGTGNVVHNLRMIDWDKADEGYDWAYRFDHFIMKNVLNRNHENILNHQALEDAAKLAVPTPDHFNPLLYILGASDMKDGVSVYNQSCMMGSLSMTSYLFEA
jgi:4,5-DOPA dioxygenase extradiol